MRILVVNDDGVLSPGIVALAETAARMGEVWVVAPLEQCSAMSQKLTIFDEMAVRRVDFPAPVQGAWSVGGSPADCVMIAYSGTVGACHEAVMRGIPAIAFSNKGRSDLSLARERMESLARELIALGQAPGEIWNINFPGCPAGECRGVLYERRIAPVPAYRGLVSARREGDAELIRLTGVPCTRAEAPDGTDIAAVLDGYISVGKIQCPVL